MPKILVATPANVGQPYLFADGLSIEHLPNILWDRAMVKAFISDNKRQSLEKTQYWLCARKEVEHIYAQGVSDDLMEKVTYGAWALQIICPTGAEHIFLLFHDGADGYDNIRSRHGKPHLYTLMGKLASRDELGLAQYFDTIYAGIRRAFADKIIRLTNPIELLEHGLQADNLYISTLLCVMGLDMLLMAGKITPFVERACGFLGPSTYVFPLDSCYNCQPSPTVADVIADVYKLRNVIAHGQRVPPRYLQPYTLRCTNGVQVNDTPYPYRYGELMQEAARFLLTASLRKIFTAENLLDHVNDDKKWGFQMSLFERRQRATAPAPVAKRRGR